MSAFVHYALWPILEDGNRLMRIVLLGTPGSGKGTQAALLEKQMDIPHISTGVLFRSAVKQQTPLGRQIKSIMDSGELVPDDITLELLEQRMNKADAANGFILDGYPRNLRQAESLDELLDKLGWSLDGAVQIDVNFEEVISRIARRASKEGRSDDSENVARNRLRVYKKRTAPVIDYYAEKGLLTRVLGTGTIEEVLRLILSVLETGKAAASA